MIGQGRKRVILGITLLAVLLLPARPALADGGPYIDDQEVWRQLEEGQQNAVVQLSADGTAHTDLFVSILDHSGDPHEFTFFVPLGVEARAVDVEEMKGSQFNEEYTQALDARFNEDWEQGRDYRQRAKYAFVPGAVLLSGGWLWGVLGGLCSCGAGAPAPEQVFETSSGRVAIYGMDESVDVETLIETTGLPEGVRETLETLRGQRLAIATIVTNPAPEVQAGAGASAEEEEEVKTGLRLSWTSTMLPDASGHLVHPYPLGTGKAWANPIPLTRVYVLAPPEIGFDVQAPTIGEDYSGFTPAYLFGPRPLQRIYEAQDRVAYAIDEIVTPEGQLWRGVYTHANPSDDVVVTLREPLAQPSHYEKLSLVNKAWGGGVGAALLVWLLAWRYLLGRFVEVRYSWFSRAFWEDSLYWLIVGPIVSLGFLLSLGFAGWLWIAFSFRASLICMPLLLPLGLLAHVLTALRFARRGPGLSQAPVPEQHTPGAAAATPRQLFRTRAFRGFLTTALVSNVLYVVLVFLAAAYLGI
jgi:hypothetical protein